MRSLRKNLEAVPGKHSIDSLQKTAILGTSHIIRKVLQCEAWSLSSGDHRWFKRSTRKKRPVTRDDDKNNNNNKQQQQQQQSIGHFLACLVFLGTALSIFSLVNLYFCQLKCTDNVHKTLNISYRRKGFPPSLHDIHMYCGRHPWKYEDTRKHIYTHTYTKCIHLIVTNGL